MGHRLGVIRKTRGQFTDAHPGGGSEGGRGGWVGRREGPEFFQILAGAEEERKVDGAEFGEVEMSVQPGSDLREVRKGCTQANNLDVRPSC